MRKTYGAHCPIARALDVVGERWTLLLVRELLLGPLRYSDLLAALPGIGTRVLAERLRHLVDEEVIETRRLPPPISADVYQLTERGQALAPVASALAMWGRTLMTRPRKGDARSPTSAMLAVRMRAQQSRRPRPGRWQLVIGDQPFELRIDGGRVIARRGEVDAPDGAATVSPADVFALMEGRVGVDEAVASGRLRLEGELTAETFGRLVEGPSP